MKTKLMMMGALAAACAAHELAAMPTEEETRQAEPVVQKLLASERAALKSGKKTRSEVAAAAMKLADEADNDAAKLLLMKGAFTLYVQDGNLEKAVETMKALKATIPDIPPQSVTNIIEAALLEVSKKEDGAPLYKLLGEKRGADFGCDMATKDAVPNVEYKFRYKLDGDNAVITEIDPKPVGTVVVPDKIDGHLVTAFQGYPSHHPFDDCDSVTKVVLPAGMKGETFNSGGFIKCKSLSSIEVSKANKDFASSDGVLYSKDFSTLFVYPKTRESVKLSPKTRMVKACAFRGCALKTAKIPEGIVEVDSWNLCQCPDLESIEFPKTLKRLGPCAAWGNDKLKKIVFNGDAPQAGLAQFSWGKQVVFTGAPEDLVVEVRKGTKGWKSPGSTELPERWPVNQSESRPIRYIGEAKKVGAERDASKAGTLRRPEVVEGQKSYGGYTWSYRVANGEAALEVEKDGKYSCAVSPTPTGKVSIPPTLNYINVTRIGNAAFMNCEELTSVTIPEGVTHIDTHALAYCGGLKSVTLPSSLKDIGYGAFGKCRELTSVTIPNGVKSIGADAFNGCGLKSLVIPESVTRIGDRAFCGCRELESVAIPSGVVSLGKGVFGECDALKIINVDSGNQSFTSIDGVLYTKDRSELVMYPNPPASVVIPKGVTKIRGWAFAGGKEMTSLTIPEGVTNIGDVAFLDCVGLKSVTIPSSVKKIEEHAFGRCGELAEVTMLGERPEAANEIFKKCGKLKSIHVPANAKSWAGMKEWQGIPLVFDGDNAIRQMGQ